MFQFPVLVITVFSRNSQLYNPVAPIQMFAFSTLLLLLIYFSHFSSFFFFMHFSFLFAMFHSQLISTAAVRSAAKKTKP